MDTFAAAIALVMVLVTVLAAFGTLALDGGADSRPLLPDDHTR